MMWQRCGPLLLCLSSLSSPTGLLRLAAGLLAARAQQCAADHTSERASHICQLRLRLAVGQANALQWVNVQPLEKGWCAPAVSSQTVVQHAAHHCLTLLYVCNLPRALRSWRGLESSTRHCVKQANGRECCFTESFLSIPAR